MLRGTGQYKARAQTLIWTKLYHRKSNVISASHSQFVTPGNQKCHVFFFFLLFFFSLLEAGGKRAVGGGVQGVKGTVGALVDYI